MRKGIFFPERLSLRQQDNKVGTPGSWKGTVGGESSQGWK